MDHAIPAYGHSERNCYGANGIFDAIVEALYPGRTPPRPRSYNDAEGHIRDFARAVWLPTFSRECRADRCELYGRTIRAHAILKQHVSPSTSTWHSQNYGLCRTFATFGGLIFLAACDLKKTQRSIIELVPFYPPLMHRWIGGKVASEHALPGLVFHLLDTCWEIGPMTPEHNGIQYFILHLKAPPRHYQPGRTTLRVQRGQHKDHPRWPFRYAEHHANTACERT